MKKRRKSLYKIVKREYNTSRRENKREGDPTPTETPADNNPKRHSPKAVRKNEKNRHRHKSIRNRPTQKYLPKRM